MSIAFRTARPTFQRLLARRFGTQDPPPPLPTSHQSVTETFSDTSKPRPYNANHPPFRELPRLKVYLSTLHINPYWTCLIV